MDHFDKFFRSLVRQMEKKLGVPSDCPDMPSGPAEGRARKDLERYLATHPPDPNFFLNAIRTSREIDGEAFILIESARVKIPPVSE